VVAAAVILPQKGFNVKKVNDSKLLTAEQREESAEYIKKKALAYAVAEVDHVEIDKINILKASIKAMHLAVFALKIEPELLLIDGNYFIKYPGIPHKTVVKGDSTYASIAAASVLAKVHRDALMDKLHEEHPVYGWVHNKGYSTKIHQHAILEHGLSPYHRRTYKRIMDYENSLFPEYAVMEVHEPVAADLQ
jgi:ribonuclease HII